MNWKLEYKWTTNNKVHRVLHKKYLERNGKISCGICPYHRYENQRTYYRKSWKYYRKKQWDRSDIGD